MRWRKVPVTYMYNSIGNGLAQQEVKHTSRENFPFITAPCNVFVSVS